MKDAPTTTASRLTLRWQRRFPDLAELGAKLVARYGEGTRRYHDVRHLDEVLARLDELAAGSLPATVVELAAWFHDAVYDVHRSDNEAASALLAEQMLTGRLESEVVAEVARLVIVTADHAVVDGDKDAAALCDADLAILAGARSTYDDYAARVRQEYAHVCDVDFSVGRSAVLRQLLGLPHLFHTDYGAQHWESPARANLIRELEGLLP